MNASNKNAQNIIISMNFKLTRRTVQKGLSQHRIDDTLLPLRRTTLRKRRRHLTGSNLSASVAGRKTSRFRSFFPTTRKHCDHNNVDNNSGQQ